MPDELKQVCEIGEQLMSYGQLSDGYYQTVFFSDTQLKRIKLTDTGHFHDCQELSFTEKDWNTSDILSNFEGQLIRISKHKRLDSKDKVRHQIKDDITTMVFCKNIRQPKFCGNLLIWVDDESKSVKVMDIKELKELA